MNIFHRTQVIIDSTKLVVCHNLRIKRHRVFKGLAGRGKSMNRTGFVGDFFYLS